MNLYYYIELSQNQVCRLLFFTNHILNILKTYVFLIPYYNISLLIYIYTQLQSTRMRHHVYVVLFRKYIYTYDITSDRIDFPGGPGPTRAPRRRLTGWL